MAADKSLSRLGRSSRTAGTGSHEGLLASGGKVALVGLIAALFTLAFTVWLQRELHLQTEVRVPLAQGAARLNGAIGRSMAALGAWVSHGDPESKTLRSQLWREEIQPELEALAQAAREDDAPEVMADIDRLGAALRDLKRLQWLIEDIARTPGNLLARAAYEDEVRPIETVITRSLNQVLHDPQAFAELRFDLSDFRAAVIEIDRLLLALLDAYTPAHVARLENEVARAQRLATELIPRVQGQEQVEALRHVLQETEPYGRAALNVARLRTAPDWNLAEHTHRTQLVPVLTEVRDIAGRLAATQNSAMLASGAALCRWSAVVVLLALLMGLLSGGSMYTSFRIAYRMREIVAKARMLGQYAIEARLGGGGMGEVYRARHAMLRRPTAIKLLRARSAQDLRAQERFREEVQLTSQLTHPNTVDIFDYGRTPDGLFYYAMELLDGADLHSLVRSTGPVPPARAIHILLQVCGSLQEAHQKGLLHRDIKPSNIMLAERGGIFDTAKVLDFGLAQRVGTGQAQSEVVGTPMYLAPEVIRSPEAATPRSDLYALGGVAYYLLSGATVFAPDLEIAGLLRANLDSAPAAPSERLGHPLPAGLDAIVLSCLAKDPAQRPQSAEHLAQLLQEVEAGSWKASDARAWWADYGEALLAERSAAASIASDLASGLRVQHSTGAL